MNNISLYLSLAFQNIRKNGRFYFPYFLTCVGSVAGFYIIFSLTDNPGVISIDNSSLVIILKMGTIIVGIFSVIFLFYTNSFLIKRRKKEIGLYNILGMGKRHIAKILFLETVLVCLASLIAGLFMGLLLDKLVLLILTNMLSFGSDFSFYVSYSGLGVTVVLFSCIFLAQLAYNLLRIKLSKPVELLKGGSVGEKEPKTKWIMTVLGVVCIGVGYYLAITTESPLKALNIFFLAVLLVIIGTYLLFIAVTVTVLKLLRKNKRFYYKSNHFISVSGMIYRMKQNAVGLANICILSTMVLVMISATVCLYTGMEETVNSRYSGDVNLEYGTNKIENNDKEIYDGVIDYSKEQGREVKNYNTVHYLSFAGAYDGKEFILNPDIANEFSDRVSFLTFVTAEEYEKQTGQSVNLDSNEISYYSEGVTLPAKIALGELNFSVKDKLSSDIKEVDNTSAMISGMVNSAFILVVSDVKALESVYEVQYSAYGENASEYTTFISYDIDGTDDEKIDYCNNIFSSRLDNLFGSGGDGYYSFSMSSRQEGERGLNEMCGGFLFLGVFLGLLFTMAAVLIIYYKQISEGYDDKERYEIMQKVGLSKKEIKSSINSQVLIVFFMPIIVAACHVAAAFPLLTKLLNCFYFTNVSMFLTATVITVLAFALIYALVYMLTSKLYYKIVKD